MENRNFRLFKLLISYGANIYQCDQTVHKNNLLHLAYIYKFPDKFTKLLQEKYREDILPRVNFGFIADITTIIVSYIY